MKNVALKFVMLAAAISLLNGCGKPSNKVAELVDEAKNYTQPPDTDVSKSPEYYFSSFAGTVWRTKTKTALVKMKLYTGRQVTAFVPPDAYDPTDPQYRPIQGEWHIVTVLPSDAMLRIDSLIQDNGIGSPVYVIASLKNANSQATNLYLDAEFLANNSFFRGSGFT